MLIVAPEMPTFRFRLDTAHNAARDTAMEVADAESARLVAKYVARELASKELLGGRLPLSSNLLITGPDGIQVGAIPLSEVVALS